MGKIEALNFVKKNGLNLKDFSVDFKKDREIVLAAVKNEVIETISQHLISKGVFNK
tara:strand:+ start:186 stop:353 length:168 start_codon:yes stop_codon:yes gene_type:complete